MKALTVRQPWAWAIGHGDKTVENRGRGAQHWQPTADLAIHAGLTWSHRGAGDWQIWGALERTTIRADDPEFAVGAIVAIVDVVDVHPFAHCCEPWGESSYRHADGSMVQEVTHLVLENARALAVPVPCRGRLGLWTVPKNIERAVRAAVRV